VLEAIAHPLRLAVLVALDQREGTPAELAAATGAPEPAVERALGVLSDAGLIASSRKRRGALRATGRGWTEIARRLQVLEETRAEPE
jgi:DNA-binding transcriptional ArsR family regulator